MLPQADDAQVCPTRTGQRLPSTASTLRFNALLAIAVWTGWVLLARHRGVWSVAHHWRVSLTMVFGSLVGGGTSEGGAAIAFPVFTKVLHIPPSDARLFSFAIQTIGMGAASLSILYQRVPLERRALVWAGGGGILGVILSTCLLVPRVPPAAVRIFFTAMVTSLAVVLLFHARRRDTFRHQAMVICGPREKLLLVLAGLLGGALSALIGCGENIVVFMILVVLFRVNEKVVTPTTVLLMWMVTTAAFLLHLVVLRDIPAHVFEYWLAAVPIVVVGGPLGALLCSRIERLTIVAVLVSLIAVELISTLVLVDLSHGVGAIGLAAFLFFTVLNWRMSRSERYSQGVRERAS